MDQQEKLKGSPKRYNIKQEIQEIAQMQREAEIFLKRFQKRHKKKQAHHT